MGQYKSLPLWKRTIRFWSHCNFCVTLFSLVLTVVLILAASPDIASAAQKRVLGMFVKRRVQTVTGSISPLRCQSFNSTWKWIRRFSVTLQPGCERHVFLLGWWRSCFHLQQKQLQSVAVQSWSPKFFREIKKSWCHCKHHLYQVSQSLLPIHIAHLF